MADVLHRPEHEQATRETVTEAPQRVPESHEVREHRLREALRAGGARTHVRWLGWVPVMLLALAGMITALVIAIDGGTDVDDVGVIEWPTATEGPGSNSLAPTTPDVMVIEWPTATEGPGSNSLGTG